MYNGGWCNKMLHSVCPPACLSVCMCACNCTFQTCPVVWNSFAMLPGAGGVAACVLITVAWSSQCCYITVCKRSTFLPFTISLYYAIIVVFLLTSSLKWIVEHWSSAPISLCGFQVTESALRNNGKHENVTATRFLELRISLGISWVMFTCW